MLSTLKKTLIPFLLLSIAGCSTGLRIDRSHPSANQDNRIQFVVLHYTNASLERSLALLTHGEVSSHYLIGDGPATVYRAGESFSEMPGDRHGVSANASKTQPARLLAVFVVDTDETELTTPLK